MSKPQQNAHHGPEGAKREPHAQSTVANRRRHDRVTLSRPARVTELDEIYCPRQSWDCQLFDISRSGLGLSSKRMVHPDRVVLVELLGPTGAGEKVFCCVVRQSRYIAGEGHIVGVQFREMPRNTSIEQWAHERGHKL